MRLAKVLGFLALGLGVLIVGGMILGLVASVLHLVVPLAILGAIGWIAWSVFSVAKGAPSQDRAREPGKDAARDSAQGSVQGSAQVAANDSTRATPDAPPEAAPRPMTDAEALKLFEEQRKKLNT